MAAPKTVVIVGPTASGKTEAAIRIAKRGQGTVISADSRQVYAGLNIGTAKPREAWQEKAHAVVVPDVIDGIPHYLLNVCELTTTYTLSDWLGAAQEVLADLEGKKITPIIAGGTMLYVDSLMYGYLVPQVPPDAQRRTELEAKSTEELYAELIARDPEAQEFVEAHHQRRIIRALEVIEATGKKFSEQRQRAQVSENFVILGIFPGWDVLRERVEQRAKTMLNQGLVQETYTLLAKLGSSSPLLATINYAQALKIINGRLTEDAARQEMVRATLRYAHRQMSWWKRNPSIRWFRNAEELLNSITKLAPLS